MLQSYRATAIEALLLERPQYKNTSSSSPADGNSDWPWFIPVKRQSLPHPIQNMYSQNTVAVLCAPFDSSHLIVMKDEANVPRSLRIVPHEVFVSRRTFLLRVTRKHTLQAHAHALNVVDR